MRDWVTELLKKPKYLAAVLAVVVGISFVAGFWSHSRKPAGAAGGRKILHYVDPMNPAHTSPEPGLAPCGMKMEPVYAADEGEAPSGPLSPGAVKITSQKQQMIGVRVAPVAKTPYTYHLRALGKVAVDERLIYRMNASIDGWIREVGDNSTGSVVKKDETLAIFYSPEFLTSQQAYIYALSSLDRFQATGQETAAQIQVTKAGIQQSLDNLHNLGMSDLQVAELARTRQYNENIRMVAPATSFVLARNISNGQRFTAGTEWYRLADLSRVWVLADLFENEAQHIKPGEKVRVTYPYQKKTFEATVSEVLPQFDPTTRTLKVRLETDNPGFMLRPDMFVDVDFPIKLPPSINVPVDAVLDSGLKQTVFVDRGNGFFEPRKVETGWRLGDRVEITQGLQPGEKVVISGNFLIDSESRMKLAAAGLFGEVARDPVCGMNLEAAKAKAGGHKIDYQGQTYYFCSDQCQEKFHQAPERFLARASQEPAPEDQEHGHGKAQAMTEPPKAPEALPGKAPGGHGAASDPERPMAAEMLGATQDPVCHHDVRKTIAQATAPKTVYRGTTYYFCSEPCKQAFNQDPERYLGQMLATPGAALPPAAVATSPGPMAPMPPGAPPMMPASPAAPMAHPGPPSIPPVVVHPDGPPAVHPGMQASPMAPGDTGIARDIRGRPIRNAQSPMAPMALPGATPAVPPAMQPGGTPVAPPTAAPMAPMGVGIERDIRGRPMRTVPAAPLGPVSVAPPVQLPPQQAQAPQAAHLQPPPAAPTPQVKPQAPPPAAPVCPPGHEGQRHD